MTHAATMAMSMHSFVAMDRDNGYGIVQGAKLVYVQAVCDYFTMQARVRRDGSIEFHGKSVDLAIPSPGPPLAYLTGTYVHPNGRVERREGTRAWAPITRARGPRVRVKAL